MGNTGSNPWIPLTQAVQELEKVQFSYDLQKNPDDYNQYVSERINKISQETLDKKRAAFQKAHTDMGRYADMEHNANFYKIRNMDVLSLQEQMLERSRAATQGVKYDKDLTRRQAEINEWYFHDKLETLFFLQVFFIVLLCMTIIMYFQKNATISYQFAAYSTISLLCVVIGVGVYRSRYTSEYRDPRFWNKRSFGRASVQPVMPDPCGGDGTINAISDCAKKAQKAAIATAKATAGAAQSVGNSAGQALMASAAGPLAGVSMLVGDGMAAAYDVDNPINQELSGLTKETVAYITGDGHPKDDPNAKLTCPF
jgi:hypothetical protein